MHLFVFFLLEIALFFGGGTWACLKTVTNVPGKVTPPCELCPDNSFYVTNMCADTEYGCVIIPPTEVITPSTGSSGCKQAEMECPPESFVYASIDGVTFGPNLWSFFKMETGFTNIVCSDETMWLITFGGSAGVLDYIYCYNRNCTLCPDIRAPTAAECDSATPCLPPTITYNPPSQTENPADNIDCRQIIIQCPPIPTGFNTANVQFIFAGMTPPAMFTLDEFIAGDAGELACSNQAMWTLTPPGGAGSVVSTITCFYT